MTDAEKDQQALEDQEYTDLLDRIQSEIETDGFRATSLRLQAKSAEGTRMTTRELTDRVNALTVELASIRGENYKLSRRLEEALAHIVAQNAEIAFLTEGVHLKLDRVMTHQDGLLMEQNVRLLDELDEELDNILRDDEILREDLEDLGDGGAG